MTEEWRPIPGLDGYESSSFGRIKGPRGIRKLAVNIDGYNTFDVRRGKKGKSTRFRVCRVVLETFVGPSKGLEASHEDNDRSNDRVSNLKWVSRQYNEDLKTRFKTRPIGENQVQSKMSDIDFLGVEEMLSRGASLGTVAMSVGVTKQAIVGRLKRKKNREARGVEGFSKA
jgi:hypothetical protein